MWWRTRDTRATCHNRVTAIKMEHILKSSCFLRSQWYCSKDTHLVKMNFSDFLHSQLFDQLTIKNSVKRHQRLKIQRGIYELIVRYWFFRIKVPDNFRFVISIKCIQFFFTRNIFWIKYNYYKQLNKRLKTCLYLQLGIRQAQVRIRPEHRLTFDLHTRSSDLCDSKRWNQFQKFEVCEPIFCLCLEKFICEKNLFKKKF